MRIKKRDGEQLEARLVITAESDSESGVGGVRVEVDDETAIVLTIPEINRVIATAGIPDAYEARLDGLREGVTRFAWWSNGEQFVGTTIGSTLAEQAEIAQRKWGYSMTIDGLDLSEAFSEPDDAIHADYAHPYRSTKQLEAEKAGGVA